MTTIFIFGDEAAGAILGAYSLEGLGFAVDPAGRRLVPAGVLPMMQAAASEV